MTPKTDTTAAPPRLRTSSPRPRTSPMVAALGAHEAAVLTGVPLEQLALSLPAPKQTLAVALPTFAEHAAAPP